MTVFVILSSRYYEHIFKFEKLFCLRFLILIMYMPALSRLPTYCKLLKNQNLMSLAYHQLLFSNKKCLSTVECVGHALALLEENQDILEKLTKPLLALCSIQISHGALKHDSFEYKKDINNFKKENCRLKN